MKYFVRRHEKRANEKSILFFRAEVYWNFQVTSQWKRSFSSCSYWVEKKVKSIYFKASASLNATRDGRRSWKRCCKRTLNCFSFLLGLSVRSITKKSREFRRERITAKCLETSGESDSKWYIFRFVWRTFRLSFERGSLERRDFSRFKSIFSSQPESKIAEENFANFSLKLRNCFSASLRHGDWRKKKWMTTSNKASQCDIIICWYCGSKENFLGNSSVYIVTPKRFHKKLRRHVSRSKRVSETPSLL